MRITLTPRARHELQAAIDFYRDVNPRAAETFVDAYARMLSRIEEFPRSSPVIYGELRRSLIPGFPWAAYYSIDGDAATIARVVHGKRSPRSILRGRS